MADRTVAFLPASAGPRRGRGGVFLRFRRAQEGSAAIEFAFVGVPFLMMLWAIFETALMFWTTQVLEESLSQASRSILTGESRSLYKGTAAANATAFRDAICAEAPLGLIDCSKLAIDVRPYASFNDASAGTAASNPIAGGTLDLRGFGYAPPTGDQIVVVRAVLDYPLFLTGWASKGLANIGAGHRAIVASTAFRTEPFLP
jgi:Flp pilus assembly protein TadG